MELKQHFKWIILHLCIVSLSVIHSTQGDGLTGAPAQVTELPAGNDPNYDYNYNEDGPDIDVTQSKQTDPAVVPVIDNNSVTISALAVEEPTASEVITAGAAAVEPVVAVTQTAPVEVDGAATAAAVVEIVAVVTPTKAEVVVETTEMQVIVADAAATTHVAVAATETETVQDAADVTTEVPVELPAVAKTTTMKPPKPTTEAEEVETTEPVPPCDDPCCNYELFDEEERYLTHKGEKGSYLCDSQLEKKWYAFKYQNQWAEIPQVPIARSYCGTDVPFRLHLSEGETLPDFNETITATLCAAYDMMGELVECGLKKEIQIKACEGYYIYFLQALTPKCSSAVCTQIPGSDIPCQVLANRAPSCPLIDDDDTDEEEPLAIQQIPLKDLTDEQNEGVVTVEYTYPNETLDRVFFNKFLADLIKALNELPPPTEVPTISPTEAITEKVADIIPDGLTTAYQAGNTPPPAAATTAEFVAGVSNEQENAVSEENKKKEDESSTAVRRKRDLGSESQFRESDVTFVNPTPRIKDGKLQMSLFVTDRDGNVISAERLKQALDSMDEPVDPQVQKENVFFGLPSDLKPPGTLDKMRDVWKAHMGLWITIICLVVVCLLTVCICCLCFRCCESRPPPEEKTPLQMEEGKKPPSVVIENPLSDEEITKDEAPMVEHENPAFTPDGETGNISDIIKARKLPSPEFYELKKH